MIKKLNNNKINLLLLFIIIMCLGWLGNDLNSPALTGDWSALLIMEFAAQLLYNNFKT